MQNPNTASVDRSSHGKPSVEGFLSQRVQALKVSPTIAMSERAGAMRAEGIAVVNLSVGEPDTATPASVVEAAHQAALDGHTRYTAPDGHQRVKRAVQTKLRRDNGLEYDLAEIGVVSGCKQVIFNAMAATIEPGDEVIILAPYWVSYADMVRYHGGVAVIVETAPDTGFEPRPEDIAAAITSRTKWIFLNSPNNPTGAVYGEPLLCAIGAVLAEHPQVMILSDEIYEHLTYGNQAHVSLAQALPRLRDRMLLVNGVSKAYAMTGWRIGYGAGPAWLIGAMAKIQSQAAGSSNSVAQWAAAAAMEGAQDCVTELRTGLAARRKLAADILSQSPRLKLRALGGAFYLFADVNACIGSTTPDGRVLASDTDVSAYFLDTAHVATVPGVEFGLSPFIRLSYAVAEADLRVACEAILIACADLTEGKS